jgi:glycosyltransferase involved in cell wall biosynthesis
VKKIRVLQIITRLAVRGAPRHVIDLAERLDSERFDVSILTGTPEEDEGNLVEEARGRGIRVDVIVEMRRAVRPLADLLVLLKIYRFIKRGGYDIVHTHISKAGILGRAAARLAGVPAVVHTYHGPVRELQSRILRRAERWAARRTDVLIAVSEGVVDHQLSQGIGESEQYQVLPNGIDLKRFHGVANGSIRDELGTGPVIGTVGSLTPEKGTEDLISAAASLRERFTGLCLCIVGDGRERPALEAQVEQMGLSGHVVFAGNVSDVRQWLAAFDLFVLPSRSEGMSRALVEAMAAGCPVIATTVGDAPRLLVAEQLVPPANVADLAGAIAGLLSNDGKRQRSSDRSRKIAARYDLASMVGEVEKVYDEMLGTKKAA